MTKVIAMVRVPKGKTAAQVIQELRIARAFIRQQFVKQIYNGQGGDVQHTPLFMT